MFRKLFAVAALLLLTACATTGFDLGGEDKFTNAFLKKNITAGQTTMEDVRSIYGSPNSEDTNSDSRTTFWSFVKGPSLLSSVSNVIPGLSGAAGTAVTQVDKINNDNANLRFFFNRKGVVTSYSLATAKR